MEYIFYLLIVIAFILLTRVVFYHVCLVKKNKAIEEGNKVFSYISELDYTNISYNDKILINQSMGEFDSYYQSHKYCGTMLDYIAINDTVSYFKQKLIKFFPEERIKERNDVINDILK